MYAGYVQDIKEVVASSYEFTASSDIYSIDFEHYLRVLSQALIPLY
jgi:hypothetical protein